jgi:hypothetical protein
MPSQNSATLAFNRGLLSQLGLARVDLTRYRMAASISVNWMVRVLGSMMLRPGTAHIVSTQGNNQARAIPFVFGATDTARIEVTQGTSCVLVNDALVTRVAVGTTVTNGSFATNLAGWTNSSQAGATVTWQSAGQVAFVGTGSAAASDNAILDQQLTVAGGDVGKRHALRIVVLRGPLVFRCGTSQGDDSIINETTLNTGTHSLAFTPAGNVWIRFFNSNQCQSLLASCNVESAGVMTLPTPWQTADLASLRWTQSADVIYVGCIGYPQQQFERRATDSWSIVDYTQTAILGPFRTINVTNTTLTPSALTGDITLTASNPLFKPSHVGALFRLLSVGQAVTSVLGGAGQATNPVLVTGVGSQRNLQITITGSWSGTIALQYSLSSNAGPWTDVGSSESWTGNASGAYNDNNNNESIYYRLNFDSYSSGAASASLSFPTGSISGIARITGYTDNQHVSAAVLPSMVSSNGSFSGALGSLNPTTNWYEGAWSQFRGFPATTRLWQGRLWWFGSSIFASVSDDYTNFDDTVIGDSGPIIGQLDEGAVDNISWAIGLQQLVLGTASAETSCRSTYLGDPITPTNFNVMIGSTQGSSTADALQMDRSGIFVQITGSRVFSLDLDIYTYSYKSNELTQLVPDLNSAGIVQIALQNKPDRRLHCRRADGTVGVMVYDAAENVTCWLEVETANGDFIEDISILPALNVAEDQVYYIVRRTVGGQTVRFHEKWALESDCTGLPVSKCVDSHVVYQGAPVSSLSAIAPHLAGETVSVWGWNTATPYVDGNGNNPGLDLGLYVVAADGSVNNLVFQNAPYAVTNAVVGLPYTAQWQSMKQSFGAAMGTPLNQPKRISRLGLVLQNTHAQGIQFGNDFNHMDNLPLIDLPQTSSSDGSTADVNSILTSYDEQMTGFDDIWSTDSRVCLQAASPRPATCLAFTAEMTTNG